MVLTTYSIMFKKRKKAKILLEDGREFIGFSFGAEGTSFGEIVFNTSITGYQEILTDPSYKGQIVTMTYPLIGNYGVNEVDTESQKPQVEGFLIRELSSIVSNWRAKDSLEEYLKKNNIIGIEGVDTRAITTHIRLKGAMKAVITTEDIPNQELKEKVKKFRGLIGVDLVKEVTSDKTYFWNKSGRFKVVVLDCGVKFSILRELEKNDFFVVVVPAYTKAEEILSLKPDGILLSNGPGDPSAVVYVIETAKKLIGKVPIFGICLGQQILGLAFGGKTYKLKFGHHGGNHPVKDLKTNKVYITAQNHGFCVDINSLNKKDFEITHINLYDNTLEGLRHKRLPVFSVQFHPEAGPGPNDAKYIFKEFFNLVRKNNAKKKRY